MMRTSAWLRATGASFHHDQRRDVPLRFGLSSSCVWLAIACMAACDGSDSGNEGSGGAGATDPGGKGGAGGSSAPGRETCAQYLACLSQVSPAELAIAIEVYGEGGSCWTTQSDELCIEACLTGMALHHASAPESCLECVDDVDCDGSPCDEGSCLQCIVAYSCNGGVCHCGSDGGGQSCCDPEDGACANNSMRCDALCETCE